MNVCNLWVEKDSELDKEKTNQIIPPGAGLVRRALLKALTQEAQ